MNSENRRCIRCNLPETYPGIYFDHEGGCNFCSNFQQIDRKYFGIDALWEKVNSVLTLPNNTNRFYDAAVGFSGGRDSTYLLYFIKNKLKLNVLALTLSHDFMPQHTRENILRITSSLGVDHQFIENDELNINSRLCVRGWAYRPNAATIATFCTGCRYGLKILLPQYCKSHQIPLLFVGTHPAEGLHYRQDLLSINQSKPSNASKLMGAIWQAMRNPKILGSVGCARMQMSELLLGLRRKTMSENPIVIEPFLDYIQYSEEYANRVNSTIGWECDDSFPSVWRSDCYINLIRQYYYKRILGFCDSDVISAQKIRNGCNREYALLEATNNSEYDIAKIAEILFSKYNLDFDALEDRIAFLEKNQK